MQHLFVCTIQYKMSVCQIILLNSINWLCIYCWLRFFASKLHFDPHSAIASGIIEKSLENNIIKSVQTYHFVIEIACMHMYLEHIEYTELNSSCRQLSLVEFQMCRRYLFEFYCIVHSETNNVTNTSTTFRIYVCARRKYQVRYWRSELSKHLLHFPHGLPTLVQCNAPETPTSWQQNNLKG